MHWTLRAFSLSFSILNLSAFRPKRLHDLSLGNLSSRSSILLIFTAVLLVLFDAVTSAHDGRVGVRSVHELHAWTVNDVRIGVVFEVISRAADLRDVVLVLQLIARC